MHPDAPRAQGMPDHVEIPIVKEHPQSDPQTPGVFSHWEHDQYKCYACHPSTFPEHKLGFTHEAMEEEGKFCGSCHNGRTAWAVDGPDVECETCHVGGKSVEEEFGDVDSLFDEDEGDADAGDAAPSEATEPSPPTPQTSATSSSGERSAEEEHQSDAEPAERHDEME